MLNMFVSIKNLKLRKEQDEVTSYQKYLKCGKKNNKVIYKLPSSLQSKVHRAEYDRVC